MVPVDGLEEEIEHDVAQLLQCFHLFIGQNHPDAQVVALFRLERSQSLSRCASELVNNFIQRIATSTGCTLSANNDPSHSLEHLQFV